MNAIPQSGRIYGYVLPSDNGQTILRYTRTQVAPETSTAQFVMRGFIPEGMTVDLPFLTDPSKAKGAILLGTVAITQTATVAISAGVRTISVTVPGALGLAAGDPVLLMPTQLLAGYAVHNAVATSATQVDVAVTAPALAIGASFSLPCRLYRLNT